VTFTVKKVLLKRIKKHCKPSNYEVYITPSEEIVFAPTKSTRSLRYGYVPAIAHIWDSVEEAEREIMKIVPGIDILMGTRFEWDSSRPPGVERPVRRGPARC